MTCPPCIKLKMLDDAWREDRSELNDTLMDMLREFLGHRCEVGCENYGDAPVMFYLPDSGGHC